ncbi:Uncharacterised protein [uncultured archaeon]|nr:Uncharacterised protein [uncultured archaeon]
MKKRQPVKRAKKPATRVNRKSFGWGVHHDIAKSLDKYEKHVIHHRIKRRTEFTAERVTWIGLKGGFISSAYILAASVAALISGALNADWISFVPAVTEFNGLFLTLGLIYVLYWIKSALDERPEGDASYSIEQDALMIAGVLVMQIMFFVACYYFIFPTAEGYHEGGIAGMEENAVGSVSDFVGKIRSSINATVSQPVLHRLSPATSTTLVSTTTTTTVDASCFDGVLNQGEQRIDCGGPCGECGSIGVDVMEVMNCSSVKFNDVFLNLTDWGVGTKLWQVDNPIDNFKLFCGNKPVDNFFLLGRGARKDYYSKESMRGRTVIGEYRLRVSCNIKGYAVKDLTNCSLLKVVVTVDDKWGQGFWNDEIAAVKMSQEELLKASLPVSVVTNTVPAEATTTTSIIAGVSENYTQVTLRLETDCPTCLADLRYRLTNADGIASSDALDSKQSLWVIVYNKNVTDLPNILTLLKDFSPSVISD